MLSDKLSIRALQSLRSWKGLAGSRGPKDSHIRPQGFGVIRVEYQSRTILNAFRGVVSQSALIVGNFNGTYRLAGAYKYVY